MAQIRFKLVVLFFILSISFPSYLFAWGSDAHQMISDRAVASLPTEILPFYEKHQDVLKKLSVYPDVRRRFMRDKEGPRHYLDRELYPDTPLVVDFDSAVETYGWEKLKEAGYVSWRIQEMYDRLVDKMKQGEYPEIVKVSGELCHYVADAHVPLHSTINYDGQLSGDTGVHSRFESTLVSHFPEKLGAALEPPGYVEDVPKLSIQIIQDSHELVEQVLKGDRATKIFQRPEDGHSLVKALETHLPIARRRLNEASRITASLWYSAWVDAGRPNFPSLDFSGKVHMPRESDRESSGQIVYYKNELVDSMNSDWPEQAQKSLSTVADYLKSRTTVRLAEVRWEQEMDRAFEITLTIYEGGDRSPEAHHQMLRQQLGDVQLEVKER